MAYEVLSIISNILCIIGYFPEIYSNIYDVEIKVSTKIWLIWILSGFFALTYALCINDTYVIISSATSFSLNIIVFSLKTRKCYLIKNDSIHDSIHEPKQITNFNPLHNQIDINEPEI
jgi:hypothetical protein